MLTPRLESRQANAQDKRGQVMKYLVVLVSCANSKQAKRIAKSLVATKLVACVNIIPKIESVFFWQGKLDSAKEALLVLKTRKVKLSLIKKLIISLHSYQVPEIIAMPIVAGYRPYLKWIDESLR